MIVCCYAEIAAEWSPRELADRLSDLPDHLREEALRKQHWIDRQLSIMGKLLLKEALIKLAAGNLALTDLKYNAYQRPYFDTGIDFNIAHSGNIAICCATDVGKIGADIEQVNPISFDEYADYFTTNEWKIIHSYPDQIEGFYDFWTRKEAVMKAIGTGFHIALNSIDVSNDTILHDGLAFYIQNLNIRKSSKCHVATTENIKITNPIQFNY